MSSPKTYNPATPIDSIEVGRDEEALYSGLLTRGRTSRKLVLAWCLVSILAVALILANLTIAWRRQAVGEPLPFSQGIISSTASKKEMVTSQVTIVSAFFLVPNGKKHTPSGWSVNSAQADEAVI